MVLLLVVTSMRTWTQFCLLALAPLLLTDDRGYSDQAAGLVVAAFAGAGAVGTVAGAVLADRVGGRRMLLWTMPLVAPADRRLPADRRRAQHRAAVAAAGFVLLASFSVTVMMGQDYLPHRLALAAGLMIGFGAIGSAPPGLALFGAIADCGRAARPPSGASPPSPSWPAPWRCCCPKRGRGRRRRGGRVMARRRPPPGGDDLFGEAVRARLETTRPLAARMRPATLDEVVGQPALLGPGGALREAIAGDRVPSMVLYGPPGSGKTTLARVVARTTAAEFEELSAVSATVADVRAVLARARDRLAAGGRTVLFLDEIHRFNRAQQDALLPAVEDGLVTLIGATTQNPWYEVNAALVSRVRVFVLEPLGPEDVGALIDRALASPAGPRRPGAPGAEARARARRAGQRRRPRRAQPARGRRRGHGRRPEVTLEAVRAAAGGRAVVYDREGDAHYDTISAFIKSLRASDPDAAIYYLAVMISGGEDPKYIARRLIVAASEDVGNADPRALEVAVAAARAVEFVGPPGGAHQPRPGDDVHRAGTEVERVVRARSTPPWRWSSARAPAARRWPCATPAARTPATSVTARATATRTTAPTACSTSRCCPRAWRMRPSSIPPAAGRRASCPRGSASCAAGREPRTTSSPSRAGPVDAPLAAAPARPRRSRGRVRRRSAWRRGATRTPADHAAPRAAWRSCSC